MSKVAVVGTGAWGTALALHSVRLGHSVTLVARNTRSAEALRATRQNRRLPGYSLPDAVMLLEEVPDDTDLVLWAVPTQYLRFSFVRHNPRDTMAIVVCAKGVEIGTNLLPAEVIGDVSPSHRLAILTGPNFAQEVANGWPAAAVVASLDATLRERVLTALGSNSFRLYGNDDPVGAQLGGAAKNVVAIAAGAVIGAGLGENARAALVTRGLSELRRLSVALGGRAETMMGLSGLGDLLLTCTGGSSRNFSLGHSLGRGATLASIMASRSAVTEGVTTAAALVARAGDVEIPICHAVADLLAGEKTLDQVIAELLSRPQRDE